MKFIANFFITLLFVPAFLSTIILGSVKYQLLDYNFWQNNFTQNTYNDLSINVKKIANNNIDKRTKVDPLTNTIVNLSTPENVKDFIEKNLYNFLLFANGEKLEWLIYFPVKNISKGTLNVKGVKIEEYVSANKIINDFGIQGLNDKQLDNITKTGERSFKYFVYGNFVMILLLLTSMLLVDKGGRFVAPGFLFILSGGLLYLIILLLGFVKDKIETGWISSDEPLQLLLSSILPHVLETIAKTWTSWAMLSVVIGLIVAFLKKPQIKV